MSYARDTGNRMACRICDARLFETRAAMIDPPRTAEPWRHLIGSLRSAVVIHSFESLGWSSAVADVGAGLCTMLAERMLPHEADAPNHTDGRLGLPADG
jgi:hypothetical protein